MAASIVDIQNMGDALRNTGYKNIESAVAEIVDNSVEAQANDVFIIISESINPRSGRKHVTEVAFLDNGIGMNESTLAECLGIGSTTRSSRKGMGRFGVGLPQASLHACPEIEVYSWQESIMNCKKVFLDIEKVKDGTQTEIADPVISKLPETYSQYINYKTESKTYDFVKNGSLVIWKNCDRVRPKTRNPLINRLEFSLGQKFRHFINDDNCNIRIICSENQEMSIDVYANDPLFLMENNYVLGNPESPSKIYMKENSAKLEPFFEPYTNDMNKDGVVTETISYYDKNGEVAQSDIIIKFSKVKDKFYDQDAIPESSPGRLEFGKYAAKLEGISVVRANREIDFRKFDFYDNVNEPFHRWWGCEIIFNPELDEAFGVANNKQYVELKEVDEEDIDLHDEVKPVWNQLYPIVHETISAMYSENKETRKGSRTKKSKPEDSAAIKIVNTIEEGSDTDSESKDFKKNSDENELIDKVKEVLTDKGYEYPSDDDAKTFINKNLDIEYKDISKRAPLFDYSFSLGCVMITINTGHDFYTSVLEKLYENLEAKVAFELLIFSFVKAIDDTNKFQRDENDNLVTTWNEKLRKYIREQLNPSIK